MTNRNRSSLLCCAALLVLAATASAQTIAVAPKFVEGEKVHLLIETSRKDRRVDQSARTPVTVTVHSVTGESAVLVWESGETEIDNAPPEAVAMLRSMSAAVVGLRLECEFNALGEFVRLRNEAEVIEKMQLAIERMTETMLGQIPEQQTRERVRLALSQVLRPETVLASTTKNVQLYAGAAQIEVDLDTPVSIETESETAMGTVQAVVTVSARDFEEERNAAVIAVVSEPTPESIGSLTNTLLRRMLQTDEAAKLEEAMKNFVMEIRDETTYQMDLTRGWPTAVDFVRVTNVQETSRTDRTRITLQRIETP